MKFTVKLLLLALLCCPSIVFAELTEDVQADFAVVAGVVVMPINDEYIVDLDSRDNLNVGDVLTLVTPGKKIFHPVTKEVIGSVDNVVGFLQVTRIYSGYSYAKVLTAGLQPDNGAQVKRFEQVPALFVDTTETGSELVREIKVNLPQFEWLAEHERDRALLTFTLQGETLDIKDQQNNSLHKYKVTKEQQLVSVAGSVQRPTVTGQSKPQPKLLQQVTNTVMGAFGQTNEDRFAEMDEAIIRQRQADREGIWMGPNLAGSPSGVAVADLDGDGLQETAVVLDNRIVVARIVEGQFTELAEVPISIRLQVLGIDALDLDGNGRDELYLSALNDYNPASLVVELVGDNYEIVISKVPWLLRAVTFPGQKDPLLLAQRKAEAEQPFIGDVFQVRRDGDKLLEGDALPLPKKLNVFNFQPFTGDNNQLYYAYLTNGDYLKVVTDAGANLWESAEYFGGSETCYMARPSRRDEMLPPLCMPQQMVLMPGGEILVAQNDGQRMVQRFRKFKKSRLVAFGWNGFVLLENWRTASQSGYLADFVVADADNDGSPELVMAVKFKHKGLIDDARSAIVSYELD